MAVSVSEISFTYPGSGTAALKNISLTIETGEYVAVLGANGSGKSTLARCITGLLAPDAGEVLITDKGTVPSALVFQSPGDQIVAETVELDTAFGPENLGIEPQEMRNRVYDALEMFRLAAYATEATSALSSGNKQLLALAGVYVMDPSVLVLDEPTSMLSPLARGELLDFLDRWHQSGSTIIHITHDLDEAEKARRVLVMEDGQLVFDDTPENLFAVSKALQEKWGIFSPFPEKPPMIKKNGNPLECRDLTEGPLRNFSASFSVGSVTAVIGESGSGKSTLLEILAGLRVPDSGMIIRPEESTIGLAVQESEASLFSEFVADDVAYGPRNAGFSGKELVSRVASAMDTVSLPFSDFKDRRTFSLSGGERRKAALAGIIAMDTPFLLFDEPSSGLDVRSRAQLLSVISSLATDGKTIIFTTNREEECRIADTVIELPLPEFKIYEKKNTSKKELTREQITLERLRQGEVGKYKKLNTVYHNLSPVGKYICASAGITAALATQQLRWMVAVIVLSLIPVLLSRFSLLDLGKGLLKILPWLGIIALMQYGFSRGQEFNPVFLLRFIALYIPLSVFVFTTSQTEIMYGMEDILKPLSLVRFPVRDISLLTGIVFRFIPLLYIEAGRITRARSIRKAGSAEKRGFMHTLRSSATLFIPLVIRTLIRADRLAEAITARYYGGGRFLKTGHVLENHKSRSVVRHTRFFQWKTGLPEHCVVVGTILVAAALIYGSWFYGK
ncbi:MAG TPA: ATP-binding cassette domain-containing protein [Treponema sp.]|nr:ATP-binding cassette domain-containing protein [Treponema sp.]